MAADGKKFIAWDDTGSQFEELVPLTTSSGAGDSGKLIALDAQGKIPDSMMPSSTEAADPIQTTESLAPYDVLHIYDVTGNRRVKKALATDDTAPAHVYCKATAANGETVDTYRRGEMVFAIGSFVAGDVGKRVYLSAATSGKAVKAAPNATGNIVQAIGIITKVDTGNSQVLVEFDPSELIIKRA